MAGPSIHGRQARRRLTGSSRHGSIGLALLALAACGAPADQPPAEGHGELTLVILDAATEEPVPARVELLDGTGKGQVAEDALPIMTAHGRTPITSSLTVTRRFRNPQTRTDQFYSTGRSTLSLAPGRYRLKVWKGLEYREVFEALDIGAGESLRHEVALKRWIDMPARGWYGADGHIHLPRPTPEANSAMHQWMAAEDIHVANLLQMGTAYTFHWAPQYAHGKEGVSKQGHHLLISGQENPRTHFLGHAVILGNQSPINYPDEYLNLTKFFEEGRRQGALNGIAHFGQHGGAQFGLSLVLPHELLDFLEVLQFERGHYDIWYKILNTGFRMAPTAGTDYPWGHSHPGRERFYTRVRGGLTLDRWLEAVRAGNTFVTNGPMLRFEVDGKEMGETVRIPRPGTVAVEARVRFFRKRDLVTELELIENGVVVRTFPVGKRGSDRISVKFQHEVRQSGWLAVRASGLKRKDLPVRAPHAHSAPIYVSVDNTTPLAKTAEARRLARSWTVLLDDLELALSDSNIGQLASRAASAEVQVETIRQNRPALLRAIREARERFREQSR